MLGDFFIPDEDIPEFTLPTRLDFDCVLPLRDQRCIHKAAMHAHEDRHRGAEEYRIAGGYGGLGDDMNNYPRRYNIP